jgi:hypothetical protein
MQSHKKAIENFFSALRGAGFFLFLILFFGALSLPAEAAVLFLAPNPFTASEGEEFALELWIDTEGEAVNAVELRFGFEPEFLEGSRLDFGNSILSLFPEEPEISQRGRVFLAAGTPNGFSGRLPLARLFLRAKTPGRIVLRPDLSSRLFLNDASGTRIIPRWNINFIDISAKAAPLFAIESASHPDEGKWHRNRRVSLSFLKKRPEEKISYLMTRNPNDVPDDAGEENMAPIFENLDDGIWYVVAKKIPCGGEKSCVLRRRIMIDAIPPEEFLLEVARLDEAYGGRPFVSFAAKDKQSGIASYEIREFPFFGFREAKSPEILRLPFLGWSITVRSVDEAGNRRDQTIPHPGRRNFLAVVLAAGIIPIALAFRRKIQLIKKFFPFK